MTLPWLLLATLPAADLPRIVYLAGLAGEDASTRQVRLDAARHKDQKKPRYELRAEPLANPDREPLQFPPTGRAYRENGASHRIWRRLITQAPDLVLIAGPDPGQLAPALAEAGIPARTGDLKSLKLPLARSAARAEAGRRLARSPRQLAELLARSYGHKLDTVTYIPALAVLARAKLGADISPLAQPYLASRNSLEKVTASHYAGHLLFAELSRRDARYLPLLQAAAQQARRDPLDNEMSDSVFMVCPLLAAAGFPQDALAHYRRMAALDLRPDGLWRHSPLAEAAWGRGNAFALLGLALTLGSLPPGGDAQEVLLRAFRNLASNLAQQQNSEGMWRQVIDDSSSYPEFTATAMIAWAYVTGVRQGWLDVRSYQPRISSAWRAIQIRTSDSGEFLDVCESTGKQKTLADYLHRHAIWGPDDRAGAMALSLAVSLTLDASR